MRITQMVAVEQRQAARERAVDEVKRAFSSALLLRHGGSVAAAARASGMQRTYLQKLLRRHRDATSGA